MGIQIYDQDSNFNSKKLSKVKLHCTVSLGLGLKEVKIARNIMKVGVHSYLPNSHLNLWSNFNSKILIKSEMPSCGFAKVWVKGFKIAKNIAKFGMHTCLSNGHSNLWSNFNYNKLLKSETSSCVFARVGLKRGQNNSSKRCKIWHAWLFIQWASKSIIKFLI